MRFFLGLIGIAFGFLFVWKSDWVVNNFGKIEWAEQKLGLDGGTRLFWKLFGLLAIFLSMMYMFGFIDGIILGVFKPLAPAN